jgi:hypothetical protein
MGATTKETSAAVVRMAVTTVVAIATLSVGAGGPGGRVHVPLVSLVPVGAGGAAVVVVSSAITVVVEGSPTDEVDSPSLLLSAVVGGAEVLVRAAVVVVTIGAVAVVETTPGVVMVELDGDAVVVVDSKEVVVGSNVAVVVAFDTSPPVDEVFCALARRPPRCAVNVNSSTDTSSAFLIQDKLRGPKTVQHNGGTWGSLEPTPQVLFGTLFQLPFLLTLIL